MSEWSVIPTPHFLKHNQTTSLSMTSSTHPPEIHTIKRSLIVARAKNGVIGKDGDMPWRLSSDLKRFKALTSGKPVIMGRKTWESLPKRPLPKRPNIVASRNADYDVNEAWLASGLPAAYALAIAMAKKSGVDEVFVIGGAGLYQDAITHADCLHITEVQAEIEGDTWFPDFDENDWEETATEKVPSGEKDDYATIYRRLARRT